MYHTKIYRALPNEAAFIRTEVFMKEQGFENEFDDIDPIATHLVLFDGASPVGCCRYFPDPNAKEGEYLLGRVAVLPSHRGLHLGAKMLLDAEADLINRGVKKLSLSAQLRVKDFYQKQGYTPMGEIYMDEHCEHIHMEKIL